MEDTERQMFDATCSDCGAACQVPFEPTEGKPVRCRDCFMKNRPKRNNNNFQRREREMHKATCAKCKSECEVPFKPREDKPVLCRECFMKEKEDQVGKFD